MLVAAEFVSLTLNSFSMSFLKKLTGLCLGLVRIYFFMFLLLYVKGDSDCKLISTEKHQITAKDFKVTRHEKKYVMCSAFYCSSFPTVLPLQLIVHGINSTIDNLLVHLEKRSIPFSKCGSCPTNNQTSSCIPCPDVEPSRGIEIHVRLDESLHPDTSNEKCDWAINFNMSIIEFMCRNSWTANIPFDDACEVTATSDIRTGCIKSECSEKIFFVKDSDGLFQKFLPTNSTATCIWNVQMESKQNLRVSFSSAIKNYLTIYEDTLLTPKWNVKKCSLQENHIDIKPTSFNIIIVYKNEDNLDVESLLQVNISQPCSLQGLESFQNGEVKIVTLENGTFAHYSCFENFDLKGDHHFINCKDKAAQPPTCSRHHKEKVETDEQQVGKSNLSLIELDQGTTEQAKASSTLDPSGAILVEGSGQSQTEDEAGFSDMSDTEASLREISGEADTDDAFVMTKPENSSIHNDSLTPPSSKDSERGIILFSLPSIEDKMMLFIIIGVGVLLILIITVISLIVCRNRSVRKGMNRKFDTFQNPIYEKPVVRLPIPSTDLDPCQEKLDLGDLSDSTVLE